jgi:hypothetical protein
MPIEQIRVRLEIQGYDGLYVGGECACLKDDLAPCGSCDPDDAGWINGCEPGYKQDDPRPGYAGEWAMCRQKEPMCAEDFAAMNI